MNPPRFCVPIPSCNSAAHLVECLRAVRAAAASVGGAQIVVVDNGSTDGTPDLARRAGVAVIEAGPGPRWTIAAQRNAGARASSAPLLAFVDSDVVVPEQWLARAAAFFDGGFDGAVGFAERPPDDAGWVGRVWGNRQAARRTGLRDVDYLPSGNLVVSRRAFEAVGGFDGTLVTGEDKDFSLRLRRGGFRALSVPEPVVVHLGCERSLGEFVRKEFWRQSHTLLLARRAGWSPRTLRHPLLSAWHLLAPLLLAASFFTLPLAWVRWTLVLLWVAPSAIIVAGRRAGGGAPGDGLRLFLLMWLRWHVAGAALLRQLARGEAFGRGAA